MRVLSVLLAFAVGATLPARGASSEAAFISAMNTAMATMMSQMQIRPSHDVDSDFVDMMVSHHRGAIEMAKAELQYGHNESVRRLAQEIIVTQQEEIAAMKIAVGERP